MSLLNFNNSAPYQTGKKKTFSIILGIGALIGVIAIGSTLAASINLNNSDPVEFGQGVAQTVACDDTGVTLTPYSKFYNSEVESDFYFTSIKISDVSSNCAGVVFKLRAYMNGNSSPLFWPASPNGTSFEFGFRSNRSWSSVDSCMALNNQVTDDATDNEVTIDWTGCPAAFAGQVDRLTLETSTNPNAGVFQIQVGDVGPGGGLVFYVSDSDFSCGPQLNDTCRYLEVAPNGWNTGSDPAAIWAISSLGSQDVVGITDDNGIYEATGIGLGYQNSIAIMEQGNDATVAASLALSYSSASRGDWYLPTSVELNLLCQWNRGVSPSATTVCVGGSYNSAIFGAELSGMVPSHYWSSSEASGEQAWVGGMHIEGNWGTGMKSAQQFYVRPIRAF